MVSHPGYDVRVIEEDSDGLAQGQDASFDDFTGSLVTMMTFAGVTGLHDMEELGTKWLASLSQKEHLPESFYDPLQVRLQDGSSLGLYAYLSLLSKGGDPLPLESALYLLCGASPKSADPFFSAYLDRHGVTQQNFTAVRFGRFGLMRENRSGEVKLTHYHDEFALPGSFGNIPVANEHLWDGAVLSQKQSRALFQGVHTHKLPLTLDAFVTDVDRCPYTVGSCAFPVAVSSHHFLPLAEHYTTHLQQCYQDDSLILPLHLAAPSSGNGVAAVSTSDDLGFNFFERVLYSVLEKCGFVK